MVDPFALNAQTLFHSDSENTTEHGVLGACLLMIVSQCSRQEIMLINVA